MFRERFQAMWQSSPPFRAAFIVAAVGILLAITN